MPSRTVVALLPVLVLLGGCNRASLRWDLEYACVGQEQARSHFVDAEATTAITKTYPSSVDFHVRLKKAFVKTYSADVTAGADAAESPTLSFGMRGPQAWINGQYDRQTGTLTLIEERTLQISGRTQRVLTSGQYRCT